MPYIMNTLIVFIIQTKGLEKCGKSSIWFTDDNRRYGDTYCWAQDNTLGSAQNEQIDAKKTARCRRVLVATELFNIAANDFDAK